MIYYHHLHSFSPDPSSKHLAGAELRSRPLHEEDQGAWEAWEAWGPCFVGLWPFFLGVGGSTRKCFCFKFLPNAGPKTSPTIPETHMARWKISAFCEHFSSRSSHVGKNNAVWVPSRSAGITHPIRMKRIAARPTLIYTTSLLNLQNVRSLNPLFCCKTDKNSMFKSQCVAKSPFSRSPSKRAPLHGGNASVGDDGCWWSSSASRWKCCEVVGYPWNIHRKT